MEAIRNAVTVISVTSVLYGVLSMLLPYENMGKSFKYVVSLSLLTSVALSLQGINPNTLFDFDLSADTYDLSSEFSQSVTDMELEATKVSVSNLIEQRIGAEDTENVQIDVSVDISEDNGIIITEVIIICEKGDAEKINKATVGFGLPIKIIENGG